MSEQIDPFEQLAAEAEQLGLENWRVTPGALGSLVSRAYELGAKEATKDAKELALKIIKDNGTDTDAEEVA